MDPWPHRGLTSIKTPAATSRRGAVRNRPKFYNSPMSVFTLGLNHTTAPVDMRGRFAFAPEQLSPALRGFRIFLCGHPELVAKLRKQVFLAGASRKDIASDAFLTAPPPAAVPAAAPRAASRRRGHRRPRVSCRRPNAAGREHPSG